MDKVRTDESRGARDKAFHVIAQRIKWLPGSRRNKINTATSQRWPPTANA
jgi:hypothetical protein